jgi:hypothetical protein
MSKPETKPVNYIYNQRLQLRLAALDALRPNLRAAVTRLTQSNDRLELKAKR